MKKTIRAIAMVFLAMALAGCSESFPATGGSLSVWQSPALGLWFNRPAECAAQLGISLVDATLPDDADIALYFGAAPTEEGYTYQVGTGVISVVSNEPALVGTPLETIGTWFTSAPADGMDVIVYPPSDDIMAALAQPLLAGKPVYSGAILALDNQQMIIGVMGAGTNVGLLPAPLATAQLTILYQFEDIPVLAATKTEPTGPAQALIACLQHP